MMTPDVNGAPPDVKVSVGKPPPVLLKVLTSIEESRHPGVQRCIWTVE